MGDMELDAIPQTTLSPEEVASIMDPFIDSTPVTAGNAPCTNESLSVNIWPLPKEFTRGNARAPIRGKALDFMTFNVDGDSIDTPTTLKKAFERYHERIFKYGVSEDSSRSTLHLQDTSEAHIQLDTDESYELSIDDTGEIRLESKSIYGALRGLETLAQLIDYDFDTAQYYVQDAPWHIRDEPRFPHRGLLVDTSRHFIPLPFLRRTIDAMVHAKLNVFHWHIVDDESWPMESKTYPTLWNQAYSKYERYSIPEIKSFVEYARLRGVRVMPELDSPGHTKSFCKALPEACPQSCDSPLHPGKNITYEILNNLLKEWTGGEARSGLFPDDMLHTGGDEVKLDCWNSDPEVKAWLNENEMNVDQAYRYFSNKMAEATIAHHRRPVQWVEVFEKFGDTVDKNTIIAVWKGKNEFKLVLEAGYSALLCDQMQVYLDHLKTEWHTMYLDEPMDNIKDESLEAQVLGGHTSIWSEHIDGSVLDNTAWPRTAAYAERLWSPRDVNDLNCALPRLKWFRCLLLQNGIGAAPVTNHVARQGPQEKASCQA